MELRQRKSNRLKGYDYSQNGAYFVTICIKNRYEMLSDICRGWALLSPIGEVAENQINTLSKRYNVKIDKYVIMPNHIHMIIVIMKGADTQSVMQAEQSPAPTISDIICTFKSISTKLSNKYNNTPGRQIWQRSYHDHIIRNEQEYQKIWQYIDTNTLKWEDDCFYRK
ncbi:transposase [Paludicola sp. MB14-C6]|uniref:transposase n=1 Tax=Paludihabitans sp. MB14-C6 TaxID=3070656 RepID=UPI0027DD2261|nr:transposase [Paludicola sp. MB14-C6]WMJ22852.1 transposase [Paludicola sp. MB14-C6]